MNETIVEICEPLTWCASRCVLFPDAMNWGIDSILEKCPSKDWDPQQLAAFKAAYAFTPLRGAITMFWRIYAWGREKGYIPDPVPEPAEGEANAAWQG